jgi:hypothetical protein
MAFVPEGQADSSQARSAWNHEKNSLVPAGRLIGSRLRLGARQEAVITISPGLTMTATVPPGRRSFCIAIQALRTGYYHGVPPGQNALTRRGFA